LIEVPWIDLQPNIKNAWLTEGLQADFENFLPIGSKETKTQQNLEVKAIFKNYSGGVKTNRDEWVYDFDKTRLSDKVTVLATNYNEELERWKKRPDKTVSVDSFVNNDNTRFKWSEGLKNYLTRGIRAEIDKQEIRPALFRPFCSQWLYFNRMMVERVYQMPNLLPHSDRPDENPKIWLKVGTELPSFALMTNKIPDLLPQGGSQCFPLYTYALDGKIRRDNVTDWALAQFQAQYGADVTKRDIFHYVYGLLHSPEYRERYKENLKRELPRIPLVEEPTPAQAPTLPKREGEEVDEEAGALSSSETLRPPVSGGPLRSKEVGSFRAFVAAGAALAALHVGYEQAEEYPLTALVNKDVPFSWRVTKMRLNKDKTAVVVNESLTLAGIPPEVFDYKLGNRSALEWVLDQYQVSTDKRSGIETDPNRTDDPEYIVRLVRRVVTVSVETAKIVKSLPPLTPTPAALS